MIEVGSNSVMSVRYFYELIVTVVALTLLIILGTAYVVISINENLAIKKKSVMIAKRILLSSIFGIIITYIILLGYAMS